MRYYLQLNGNCLFVPQTLFDIGCITTYLFKSLTEDLFRTGDIETLDYCMQVYTQFVSRGPLDYFIRYQWEIRLALNKMRDELFNFSSFLQRLFTLIYSLFPKKIKI